MGGGWFTATAAAVVHYTGRTQKGRAGGCDGGYVTGDVVAPDGQVNELGRLCVLCNDVEIKSTIVGITVPNSIADP